MSTLPLAGLRVLELDNYTAAPTAGRLLAEFGADVIEVERPGTGDEIRTWRRYRGHTSMLYRTLNRNKKSVELDLRSDAGRAAALELAANCDVVLENGDARVLGPRPRAARRRQARDRRDPGVGVRAERPAGRRAGFRRGR